MADRLGTQVGNYRLTQVLGQGYFAEVYLGVHIHLGTQAAIKLLHAPLASAGEIEKFRQEARTIATLHHPHILRVLEFGIEAGQPYLVLEHARGGSSWLCAQRRRGGGDDTSHYWGEQRRSDLQSSDFAPLDWLFWNTTASSAV